MCIHLRCNPAPASKVTKIKPHNFRKPYPHSNWRTKRPLHIKSIIRGLWAPQNPRLNHKHNEIYSPWCINFAHDSERPEDARGPLHWLRNPRVGVRIPAGIVPSLFLLFSIVITGTVVVVTSNLTFLAEPRWPSGGDNQDINRTMRLQCAFTLRRMVSGNHFDIFFSCVRRLARRKTAWEVLVVEKRYRYGVKSAVLRSVYGNLRGNEVVVVAQGNELCIGWRNRRDIVFGFSSGLVLLRLFVILLVDTIFKRFFLMSFWYMIMCIILKLYFVYRNVMDS